MGLVHVADIEVFLTDDRMGIRVSRADQFNEPVVRLAQGDSEVFFSPKDADEIIQAIKSIAGISVSFP
jgi:hypothetical protein